MEDIKFPQHFRFIIPIIEVLNELGGSGRAGEVVDLVIEKLNISEEEIAETIKSGASRIKNQIQWARLLLVKTGYLDSSQRGVWSLTEKGLKAELTEKDLIELYEMRKQWGKEYRKSKSKGKIIKDETSDGEQGDEEEIEIEDFRSLLLNTLLTLPPSGFERLCQELLRESGFEKVTVTGKSGDGGIDGIGLFQVNPFVTFNILFQCKRYQGSVSASHVRDFKGAVIGKAEKGIILTTGTFTTEAKKEAQRERTVPIELIDGEKLIKMFEDYQLGLKPIKTYEIDEKFFDKFRNLIPKQFEIHIGGYSGTSYSVEKRGDTLVYKCYGTSRNIQESIVIHPLNEQWRKFWITCDEINIWNWEIRYENPKIIDGYSWKVRINIDGKSIDSSGSNQKPGGLDELFMAVSKLLGGLSFN